MKACLKKYLKDSQTVRNKILWSDGTMNFFGLNSKRHVWRKGTAHRAKHRDDENLVQIAQDLRLGWRLTF